MPNKISKSDFDPNNRIKPFPTNLRALMREHSETQADLASVLMNANGTHVSRQTVSYYINGESDPDYRIIRQIAEHYHVSADWLIGMPGAIKSTDTDMQQVCKYLGLSELCVTKLRELATPTVQKDGYTSYSLLFDILFGGPAVDSLFKDLNNAAMFTAFSSGLENKELFFSGPEAGSQPILGGLNADEIPSLLIKKAFDRYAQYVSDTIDRFYRQ